MASFTLDDLQAILDKCLPDDEAQPIREDNADVEFSELGYDSLVMAELAVRLRDDYGYKIADETLDGLLTPAALAAYLAQVLPAAS